MRAYWPLLGVAVDVASFALRRNPVLVVVIAGLVSGLAAGMPPGELLALLGTAFVGNRVLLLFALTLPVIGVRERAGLRGRARAWLLGFARLTLTRLLIAYLAMRQLLSVIGLINIAGHAQTVLPLLAPMSEATATRTLGALDDVRDRLRTLTAATDNDGVFFGENVFLAFGAVLLIQAFYARQGIQIEPTSIALWALPTAITAFVIHASHIAIFQLRLESQLVRGRATPAELRDEHGVIRAVADGARADRRQHRPDERGGVPVRRRQASAYCEPWRGIRHACFDSPEHEPRAPPKGRSEPRSSHGSHGSLHVLGFRSWYDRSPVVAAFRHGGESPQHAFRHRNS